ncbi:hypothetical protein DFH06DRAFT_1367240 [Mycena polygramma]|nr:hypothetical protein DFH06DRAFT_1367240 [Mycena polygramma]
MICIPKSSADSLPDEVLAAILKLVADLPVLSSSRTPPAPVAASRVSCRWRVVALGSPELWTNIRMSHHRSWSWAWAAVFVKRSLSYPLDITINLEAWRCLHGEMCDAPIPLRGALAIVGPHISRWRTFAFRAFAAQFVELAAFVGRSPVKASQLEYSYVSLLDWHSDEKTESGRPIRALSTLDIVFNIHNVSSPAFRQILGPLSQLTTLIIRKFHRWYGPAIEPIDCSTIKSFVIDFGEHLYEYTYTGMHHGWPGFESLTNILSLPNLEHLEILGGFSGSLTENNRISLPEEWEAPLFPHLRTLRLEDVGFSCRGLAFIQSLSQNITALQLVYTKGEHHLLTNPAAWPALRELTVEMVAGIVDLEWVAPFVVTRAALGMPLSDITLPPWVEDIASRLMVAQAAPTIHWQRPGPSPALMDGLCGPGFYIDEYDMRAVDFEHVPYLPWAKAPRIWDWCDTLEEWRANIDGELLEEEIEWELKMGGEVLRSKGLRRELARKRRHTSKVGSRTAARAVRSGSKSWRYNYIAEEFSVA